MPTSPSIGRRVLDRAYAAASAVSPRTARAAGRRLMRQGRFDEAETLLAAAAAAFPRHLGVLSRYAFVAHADQRYAEAVTRWRAACAVGATDAAPWRGLAASARYLGDIEGATEAVERALALRPDDWRVLLEAARVEDRADRQDRSVVLWARLVARRRDDPICRQGYADCLVRLGRLDEADKEIETGLARHPGHQGLIAAKGLLTMRREDWDEAFAVWSAYTAAYPDDEAGRIFLSRVTSVRQLATAAAHDAPEQLRAPVAVERVEDEATRELMLRFEGIGSDCEFGTVQRRYGAEPLALLRWNDVTFATLAAALEARFEAMGEPETTELAEGSIGELYVRDKRWDLGMHTFLFAHEVSRDTLFPKMCRRVAYLRDKFLDDLVSAEKVFVFKSLHLRFDELIRLHALLRAYGPVRLLHVRSAVSAGLPPWPEGGPGTVAVIAPDLYVGYVGKMGDLTDVPFAEWVDICRAVVERVDVAAREAAASVRLAALSETGA